MIKLTAVGALKQLRSRAGKADTSRLATSGALNRDRLWSIDAALLRLLSAPTRSKCYNLPSFRSPSRAQRRPAIHPGHLRIANPHEFPKIFLGNVSFPGEDAADAGNKKNKQVGYG